MKHCDMEIHGFVDDYNAHGNAVRGPSGESWCGKYGIPEDNLTIVISEITCELCLGNKAARTRRRHASFDNCYSRDSRRRAARIGQTGHVHTSNLR